MEDWTKRVQINGDLTGIFADYHYVGTGDVGGSPQPRWPISAKFFGSITAESMLVKILNSSAIRAS